MEIHEPTGSAKPNFELRTTIERTNRYKILLGIARLGKFNPLKIDVNFDDDVWQTTTLFTQSTGYRRVFNFTEMLGSTRNVVRTWFC